MSAVDLLAARLARSLTDHPWRLVVGAALAGAVWARETLRDRRLARFARQLVLATITRVIEDAGRVGARTA